MVQISDKRKYVRLNLLADVSYKKSQTAIAQKITIAKNIGIGGMCLIVYELVKVGDVLSLNIFLPNRKESIVTQGRVVWVSEFVVGDPETGRRLDAGIEFINLEKEDADLIRLFKGSEVER